VVLRNELGGACKGGHDEAFDLALHGVFFLFFLLLVAAGVPADECLHALEFGEGFIEAALGGGAVAQG
jgi:hypothetical protein